MMSDDKPKVATAPKPAAEVPGAVTPVVLDKNET